MQLDNISMVDVEGSAKLTELMGLYKSYNNKQKNSKTYQNNFFKKIKLIFSKYNKKKKTWLDLFLTN